MFRLAMLLPLFLLTGCAVSLHPLHTDRGGFDERLAGEWRLEKLSLDTIKQPDVVTFNITKGKQRNNPKHTIQVAVKDESLTTELSMECALAVTKIGGHFFADVRPDDPKKGVEDLNDLLIFRVYQFFHFEFDESGDELRIKVVGLAYFHDRIKSEKITFVERNGRHLITSSTADLRQHIEEHGLGDLSKQDWNFVLKRVKPESDQAPGRH